MIVAAITFFSLAVVLGLFLVILGVRYQRGSRRIAAAHAGVALLGIAFLGVRVFSGPIDFLYNSAALLFVLALAGGLMLLTLRLSERDQHTPPSLIGVSLHAAMGLFALLLLVLGYLRAS